LAELKDAAAKLNAQSDSINEIIQTVERQIAATNVGLELWERLDDEELGWSKLNDRWCFVVRSWLEPEPDDERREPTCMVHGPLLGEPRTLRIKALEMLPQFVRRLTSEAREAIKIIERAKALVS